MVFLEYPQQFVKHVLCEGVDGTAIQFHHQNVWTLTNQKVPGKNARLPIPVACDAHRQVTLPWRGVEKDT
jgi:hypothetical protein